MLGEKKRSYELFEAERKIVESTIRGRTDNQQSNLDLRRIATDDQER